MCMFPWSDQQENQTPIRNLISIVVHEQAEKLPIWLPKGHPTKAQRIKFPFSSDMVAGWFL
jgi:hypothetical protein